MDIYDAIEIVEATIELALTEKDIKEAWDKVKEYAENYDTIEILNIH